MYISTTFIMFECLVVMCFCKVGIKFVGQIFMCFIFRPLPCMCAGYFLLQKNFDLSSSNMDTELDGK